MVFKPFPDVNLQKVVQGKLKTFWSTDQW